MNFNHVGGKVGGFPVSGNHVSVSGSDIGAGLSVVGGGLGALASVASKALFFGGLGLGIVGLLNLFSGDKKKNVVRMVRDPYEGLASIRENTWIKTEQGEFYGRCQTDHLRVMWGTQQLVIPLKQVKGIESKRCGAKPGSLEKDVSKATPFCHTLTAIPLLALVFLFAEVASLMVWVGYEEPGWQWGERWWWEHLEGSLTWQGVSFQFLEWGFWVWVLYLFHPVIDGVLNWVESHRRWKKCRYWVVLLDGSRLEVLPLQESLRFKTKAGMVWIPLAGTMVKSTTKLEAKRKPKAKVVSTY